MFEEMYSVVNKFLGRVLEDRVEVVRDRGGGSICLRGVVRGVCKDLDYDGGIWIYMLKLYMKKFIFIYVNFFLIWKEINNKV